MGYHHLALAAKDMKATHDFYERIMGFELVKVEVAPIPGGGWGKHFFYRMDGDDKRFIAFWELHETAGQDGYKYDLNEAAGLPPGTNHYSFTVEDPALYTEAWLAEYVMKRSDEHVWEYACHEANYSLPNILKGGRAQQARQVASGN